ncbi:Lar family restriction alleviation protein [Pseudomonas atagonensis]|uniref:Lar family restriction alleviation protein n=1 Tax=Pseudomonas atagonensis TaxID=2609964 RepID=UPI001FE40554|nr:Lar family restriction alleviation protein [Pseudomonas atagonensis]
MSDATELLPCPFCGSSDHARVSDDQITWISCTACSGSGPFSSLVPVAGETTWNTRATHVPPAGELPEVVAVINEEGEHFKETVVEHRPGIDRLPVGTELVDRAHVMRLQAERDALQLRLNAADQLIADQSVALKRIYDRADAFAEDECSMRAASVEVIRDIAARALGMDSKPPVYKPGLYAVRHIDNWDGERDVVLTFAMLDADGKWTDKETGDALLTYRGDKVLRAWPLDCSEAPDTQIIGVPRNWLEDWAIELVEAAQDGGQMSNQVEHLLEIHARP